MLNELDCRLKDFLMPSDKDSDSEDDIRVEKI